VGLAPPPLHDGVHARVRAALAPPVGGAPAGGRVALDGTAGPHNQPAGPRGPVWYTIPYVGFVMDRIDADGRGLLVPLVAVGLVAFAGWLMLSWIASTRRRKAAAMRRARRLQPQSAP